jgi:hypothetical protein
MFDKPSDSLNDKKMGATNKKTSTVSTAGIPILEPIPEGEGDKESAVIELSRFLFQRFLEWVWLRFDEPADGK